MNDTNGTSRLDFGNDEAQDDSQPLAPSFLAGAPINDDEEVTAVEAPVEEAVNTPVEASEEVVQDDPAIALDEASQRREAEKKSVLDQIASVVKAYSLTVEEVIEVLGGYKPKRKSSPAKPKYRNPETGVTWSGRGKEPLWIRGKDRSAFLI